MPKIAGDPLTKVTLNLFTADVEWFRDRYGQGYSEMIREAIRVYIQEIDRAEEAYP